MKRRMNKGFTLIEALIVIAISLVLAGIALPVFLGAMNNYRLNAAVSAAAGALSTTRFQAIMHGYSYQIVFTSSGLSYQVYNEVPPATTYSAVGSAIPLPSAGPIAMTGTNFTCTFTANGIAACAANPGGASSFQLKLMHLTTVVKSNTITVSGVGNVSVTNP